jgi:hypothetical protein
MADVGASLIELTLKLILAWVVWVPSLTPKDNATLPEKFSAI